MTARPGKRDAVITVITILLRDVEELKAVGCDLYVGLCCKNFLTIQDVVARISHLSRQIVAEKLFATEPFGECRSWRFANSSESVMFRMNQAPPLPDSSGT